MVGITETKLIECDELGDKIKLEISSHYLEVTVGEKTYYFNKETGEFDGTSWPMKED